jgi:hypothetical protein
MWSDPGLEWFHQHFYVSGPPGLWRGDGPALSHIAFVICLSSWGSDAARRLSLPQKLVLVLALAGASSSSSTSANTSTSASTSASPSTSTSISIGASTMLCRTNIQVVLAHVLHATLRMSCTQPCASVEYFRVSICRSTLSSLRLRYFRKMLQSA